MTDQIVVVEADASEVFVDTGTPVTTIVDNTTGLSTVVDASPIQTIISDERPNVVVRSGSGGHMDLTSIMTMLTGRLTPGHMDPNLYQDLNMLRDLWVRIGNDLLLTYPDGVIIQEAGRSYTTQAITDTVNSINVTIGGAVSANTSLIQQTAVAITQSVNSLELAVNGDLAVHDSRITQTATDINQTVTALVSTDGLVAKAQSDILQSADQIALGVTKQIEADWVIATVGSRVTITEDTINQTVIDLASTSGLVTLAQSDIIQQAASIALGVTKAVEQDGAIATVGSRVTITEDTISSAVTAFDNTTSRVTAAEIAINETSVTLSASSQYLTQKIETVQTLLDNQWGVTIGEDVNGNSYVAGFSLLLHPAWVLTEGYAVGDTVYFLSNGVERAYVCILTNIGDITNSPVNTLYWTEVPGSAKSIFTVSAEQFQVTGPDGNPVPLFLVDGVTNVVTINGALVVKLIKSDGFDSGIGAGFNLDPTTGIAEFRNMVMTFSSVPEKVAVQTALGVIPELFVWEGVEPLNSGTGILGADEWTFDGGKEGGVLIQIEVTDDFVGELDVALNGEILTMVYWDSGSILDDVEGIIDLTQAGENIDFGGI
jgi:hypothetical protein